MATYSHQAEELTIMPSTPDASDLGPATWLMAVSTKPCARGRERAVHHGRAASWNRIWLGVRGAAVRDRAAARRYLLPARAERARPGQQPASGRNRRADPRRGDGAGPGGPGRHGQDPAGRGVHPRHVELPGGGD